MTVTRRIRRRGEHEISRKTIACGNAGCSGGPVVTTLVCVTTLCARGCGCGGHPAFPTPSVGRKAHARLGRIAPRGAEACLVHYSVRGLHPSRRRFAPRQDEVAAPHGEERGNAARREPRGRWLWSGQTQAN